MKKKRNTAILLLCLLFLQGCKHDIIQYEEESPLVQLQKDMGLGISLGNTMEAYKAFDSSGNLICDKIDYQWIPLIGENQPMDYETCWDTTPTTREIITGMKKAGFDTVRIPVFWGNMMENDGTYTINEAYIGRVKEIVDYCINADLYVVINIHHFDEFIIRRNPLAESSIIFDNLWTQIAEYFEDYSYKLMFEGYNEYLGGQVFDAEGKLVSLPRSQAYRMVNQLNQTFVDAVRKTGGNNADRPLIVSGYWTNIDLTTNSSFLMPTDTVEDRLMVSVHYVDNAMYWSNKIGGQEWQNYIKNQCDLLQQAFSSKGIPVFLGETTSAYPRKNFSSDPIYTESSECLEYVLNTLLEYGFIPVLWDTNSHFYSRTTYQINDPASKEVIERISRRIRN